jgi:hypothetical protein
MGADLEGHKEEGNRPPPVARPHCVRVRFDPYNHDQVQDLLVRTRREFPKWSDKRRWSYLVPTEHEPNVWILDFNFRDIEDAIIFGLKYSR